MHEPWIETNKNSVIIHWPNGKESEFHYAWLRDNCRCSECFHPLTHERTLITAIIPDDITATQAQVIRGEQLQVRWSHGQHQSLFSLEWLQQHNYSRASQQPLNNTEVLWGAELNNQVPTFNYSDVWEQDSQLIKWCEALCDYGLVILRGAPTSEGEVERFANRVAYVRETIYDRLHNVRMDPNAYNVASTSLELKPHTDMPNYNNPPGVQMFHFLANDTRGGESTAVDGFHVAKQLKAQDPHAYQILSNTPVSFRMHSSKGDVISCNPLLTLNTLGQLKVFRFSNQLMQPLNLSPEQVEPFYCAYKKLGRLIEEPSNLVSFKLNSGDIMATNNLRVMHGRLAFNASSGHRHLQLSYMDFDDVLSRIRMINKNQYAA